MADIEWRDPNGTVQTGEFKWHNRPEPVGRDFVMYDYVQRMMKHAEMMMLGVQPWHVPDPRPDEREDDIEDMPTLESDSDDKPEDRYALHRGASERSEV